MSGESDCIWIPDFCKMNEDVILLSNFHRKCRGLKRLKSHPSLFWTHKWLGSQMPQEHMRGHNSQGTDFCS